MLSPNTLNTGSLGATRQSWKANSPRDLLRRLIEKNPTTSEERLLTLFTDEVRENEGFLETLIEYWFTNNYRSLTRGTVEPAVQAKAREERQAKVAEIKHRVAKHIERKAQILLLDLTMPNGKKLRDCTGKECAELGRKTSAWLVSLSQKLKPAQTVGEVFTEDKVRSLYQSK
jgi:hypothetical protein